jgi:hypothetical protein
MYYRISSVDLFNDCSRFMTKLKTMSFHRPLLAAVVLGGQPLILIRAKVHLNELFNVAYICW